MKTAHLYCRNRQHEMRLKGFGKGLVRHGWWVTAGPHYERADLVVQWGSAGDALDKAKRDGGEPCMLEIGYMGKRSAMTAIIFGGKLNGRGVFNGVQDEPTRFAALGIELRPYDMPMDGYTLVMGQLLRDMSVRHIDFKQWVLDVVAELKAERQTVRFRPHPEMKVMTAARAAKLERLCHDPDREEDARLREWFAKIDAPFKQGSLAVALEGARSVVTFNSTSGVDAAIAGRPVVAADKGSMVREIAGHGIHDLIVPTDAQRQSWANRLAWKQWTQDELVSGAAWDIVAPAHLR